MAFKVLIDGRSLLSPLTGIGRYTHEISNEMIKIRSVWKYRYYYGYVSEQLVTSLEDIKHFERLKKTKAILKRIPYLQRMVHYGLDLSRQMNSDSYDLHWQPNYIPLSGMRLKTIVSSVHDFSWIHQESWHPKERIEYFQKYFWQEVPRSHRIITGSEFTKQEIVKFLNYDAEKIDVIYHGVDHQMFRVLTDMPSLSFKLPEKFILAVGSMEPRKNLITLLKAYNNLPTALKHHYKLVLIGFKGWNNEEIMALVEANKEFITYPGYISDEELVVAYNKASLFVYPSLYEGFGIPPLEAMACGTPVISSFSSSLPEVCADAALYVDPLSIDELTQKMQDILENTQLAHQLIDKGLERAKFFSWEQSAKAHDLSFHKALSR